VLALTQGGAKRLRDYLLKQGIMTRYFDTPLLKDFIRISVGKPEHTDALIASLRKFPYNRA
jgi:histidinol-phosphate aminotransferase